MSKHYSQKRDQKRYNVPYSIIEFFFSSLLYPIRLLNVLENYP